LRRELRAAARDFADELLELLVTHGVWDNGHEPGGAPATARVRRSATALEGIAKRVLEVLRAQAEPVAISTIAAALGMSPRKIAHPVSLLVAEGKIRRSGERRGARYQLARRTKRPPGDARGGPPGRAKATAKRATKTSRRPAKAQRPKAGRHGKKIPQRGR